MDETVSLEKLNKNANGPSSKPVLDNDDPEGA